MELRQKFVSSRRVFKLFDYVIEENRIDWAQLCKDANHHTILVEVGAATTYFELDRSSANFEDDVYALCFTCLDAVNNMLRILPCYGIHSQGSVATAFAVLERGEFLRDIHIDKLLINSVDDRRTHIERCLYEDCDLDAFKTYCGTADELYLRLPTTERFYVRINDTAVLKVVLVDDTIHNRLKMIRDLLEALSYFSSEVDWLPPSNLTRLLKSVELLENSKGMSRPSIIGLFS